VIVKLFLHNNACIAHNQSQNQCGIDWRTQMKTAAAALTRTGSCHTLTSKVTWLCIIQNRCVDRLA